MTSITPFGQTGPYRDYRGSELTLQAIGGPLVTNGHAEREPLKLGGHYAHYHAGLSAALATLMALRRANETGEGDWIDLSVYECQAGCRDRRVIQLTVAAYTGKCGGRLGTVQRSLGIGVRKCADGYINIMGRRCGAPATTPADDRGTKRRSSGPAAHRARDTRRPRTCLLTVARGQTETRGRTTGASPRPASRRIPYRRRSRQRPALPRPRRLGRNGTTRLLADSPIPAGRSRCRM